jgi:peptidoglycan/xylan/chitin deacetylase (PgdA/CDA1 family)
MTQIIFSFLFFCIFILVCLVIYDFHFIYKVNSEKWSISWFDQHNKTIFLTYDDGPATNGKIFVRKGKKRAGDSEIEDVRLKNAITEIMPNYDFLSTPTKNILNLLEKHNIRATFFIMGKALAFDISETGGSSVKRMVDEGHTLGNHSYLHEFSTAQSPDWVVEDMIKSHNLITQVTDISPSIYRPPRGAWNAELTHKLRENNILKNYVYPMMWSEDFGGTDAFDDPQLVEKIRNRVTHFFEKNKNVGGRIVLLHDPYIYSVLVTAELIRQAPQYGFKFGTPEKLVQDWRKNLELHRKSPLKFYFSYRLRQKGKQIYG